MNLSILRATVLAGIACLATTSCDRPSAPIVVQHGYRGLAMGLVYSSNQVAALQAANAVPPAPPLADPDGPPATSVYKNIQVLTDLNVAQFTRVMLAITEWVAPKDQSCAYCHAADMSSDENYRKVVARTMLRMVRSLNTDWKSHVGATGVTCYTCHRGRGVPEYVWYKIPGPMNNFPNAGWKAGQNAPSPVVGVTSLPNDPFAEYLADNPKEIRVIANSALPTSGEKGNIKETEETYGLMIHFSGALGVNCTYCHNSRSFTSWDASTPQRATAWYGIRMVRDLNVHYLEPLTPLFPDNRKGPLGDVAKIKCGSCHQGVYKPMFGVSMLKDYPELAGSLHPAMATEPAPADGK
jgi:photosynthetic reaction center cytochrome c subunit